MIFIKTTNGDVFVNEAEISSASHDRNEKTVEVVCRYGTRVYKDVEGMAYSDEVKLWEDEGSILKKLQYSNELMEKEIRCYRNYVRKLSISLGCYESCIDYIEEYITQDKIQEAKTLISNHADEFKKNKNDIESAEHELIDARNEADKAVKEQIEAEDEEKRKLKDEINKLEIICRTYRRIRNRSDDTIRHLMRRNLWQRIINKSV